MTFVLLHGLGGSRAQPLSLLSPALPAGAAVHAPDVRAHGASTKIGTDFSLDTLAAELVPGLPEGPLTIMGISMGAALALRLALRPDIEIERLVLIRPAFTYDPLPANLSAFPVMGELLRSQKSRPWVTAEHRAELAFVRTPHFQQLSELSPLGAAAALEQFRQKDAAARAIRLIEIPRNRGFAPGELTTIHVPTTVIAAPEDPVHPVYIAEQWAGLLAAPLELLPARDDSLELHVAATREAVARAIG